MKAIFKRFDTSAALDTHDAAEVITSNIYNGADFTAEERGQIIAALDKAIYHIYTISENEYNPDYWRVLANTLNAIAEDMQGIPNF